MPSIERAWQLIIVGSGPAGIAVALAAKRRGVRALMLERGSLCNTIFRFPERMSFFSTAELLEFEGIPLIISGPKPTKREVLDYFTRIVLANNLTFVSDCQVFQVKGVDSIKVVSTSKGDFTAEAVVLATGSYDQPNLLGIPGELLPHVSHYFSSSHPFIGKNVVVVGGKNSAAEAALELCRRGAHVTLVHRNSALSPSIKYWIRPDLENRIQEGAIRLHVNARLTEIRSGSVTVLQNQKQFDLEADAVFLLTGYNPDYKWLESIGVKVEGQAELPVHDPETLESGVQGVYLAGVLLAGRETSRVFIENSRTHGETILNHFVKNRSA